MWTVWAVFAAVLAGVAAMALAIGSDSEVPASHRLRAMGAGLAAALAFAIIAVLAATLETRGYDHIEQVYGVLAFGMLLVVATFLMSYERRRSAGPD